MSNLLVLSFRFLTDVSNNVNIRITCGTFKRLWVSESNPKGAELASGTGSPGMPQGPNMEADVAGNHCFSLTVLSVLHWERFLLMEFLS